MQTEKLTWQCHGMSIELSAVERARAIGFVVASAKLDFDAT